VYFDCHTTEQAGWTVVAVVGELDLASVPGVRSSVVAAAQTRQPPYVVLDLSGVEFIDSMGLGVVVGARKRVFALGGELRVVVATERVQRVFALSGLDTLLPLFGSLAEALVPPTGGAGDGT